MSERILRGIAASGGVAVAVALVWRDTQPEETFTGSEQERALSALRTVGRELKSTAARLREAGLPEEAEILDVSGLLAQDPTLQSEVATLALNLPAGRALLQATQARANKLAQLDSPLLAARAVDVRELGRRAVRLLTGAPPLLASSQPTILVAREVGPAEITDLKLSGGSLRGVALAAGSTTSHTAIMGRALGVPLVIGLGPAVFTAVDGETIVLDAERGRMVLGADDSTMREALAAQRRHRQARQRLALGRGSPVLTRDGHRVTLLGNASNALEVRDGLRMGAQGVGLLRTELAFLASTSWPTEVEQVVSLEPPLALLANRVATVRTFDFGADKIPPFLSGMAGRGLELTLSHPEKLTAQLRAILRAGVRTRLRILFPLVQNGAQLREARAIFRVALKRAEWGGPDPPVGAMIETPEAVERADEIAAQADFLSIGTNDLVQYTLGLDRRLPLASPLAAAAPQVLERVATVVDMAHRRDLSVEICGEAAGEAPVAALLVGLGADELSVSPPALDGLRATVRGLSFHDAAQAANQARRESSLEAALALGRELVSISKSVPT